VKLTPEDAEKIALKNLANIIRKANAGQTLSGRELAILEEASRQGAAPAGQSAFAKTQGELAQRLGISRRTITNHQNDVGAPPTRDDGRYDVAAWSKFLRDQDILDDEEDEPHRPSNWKEEHFRLRCEEIKLKLEVERREVVPIGEVIAAAGRTLTAFRTALNQLPGRCAQAIVGLKDYDEIHEVIDSEVTILLRGLEGANFLEAPPEEVIGEVPEIDPDDAEATALEPKLSTSRKPIKTRRSKTAQASKRQVAKKRKLRKRRS